MADLVITEKQNLVNLADAIREKAGLEDGMSFPAGFLEAVAGIESGGGAEVSFGTITPASTTATLTWEHGLSKTPSFILLWLSTGSTASSYTNTLRAYYITPNYGATGVATRYEAYVTASNINYMYHENSLNAYDVDSGAPWTVTPTSVTAMPTYFSNSKYANFLSKKHYWLCIASEPDIVFNKEV